MRWTPHVTVAAIIEQDNRFLLVEERINGTTQFNQPAGHWEANESLAQAVIREVKEETAYEFSPKNLVGIYQWLHEPSNTTFLRFAFCGELGARHDMPLDSGIIAAHWLTYEEIQQKQAQHRSPQVLRCIDDYRAGQRYPLSALIGALTISSQTVDRGETVFLEIPFDPPKYDDSATPDIRPD